MSGFYILALFFLYATALKVSNDTEKKNANAV